METISYKKFRTAITIWTIQGTLEPKDLWPIFS